MTKLSPIAREALQTLKDVKVVRCRFDHDGMFELMEAGLVDFRTVDGDEDALDWVLL